MEFDVPVERLQVVGRQKSIRIRDVNLTDEDYVTVRDAIAQDVWRDYVGLWAIPWWVERLKPGTSPHETREFTMRLLRELLGRRLARPGFPSGDGREFDAWALSTDESLARIEREWDQLGRVPNMGEVAWLDEVPQVFEQTEE